MLNMTNHQGNVKQSHSDISSHTCQSKINVFRDVEKRKPQYTGVMNVNW